MQTALFPNYNILWSQAVTALDRTYQMYIICFLSIAIPQSKLDSSLKYELSTS